MGPDAVEIKIFMQPAHEPAPLLMAVFPVFLWGHACHTLKSYAEIMGIGKSNIFGYLISAPVRHGQNLLCPFHPQPCQVFYKCTACFPFKNSAEIAVADGKIFGQRI